MRMALAIVLMLCAVASMAAQGVLQGRVVSRATGEALAGANVMVKTSQGRIDAYAHTDGKGCFTMTLKNIDDSMTVATTMLGYKAKTMPLEKGKHENMLITLEENDVRLKEVTVKSNGIRSSGDTVAYSVARFAQSQDRTIGDVMKRMPGIEVEGNGSIRYQGNDINKFYIEGGDLLGGKYGIATQGISYGDISAVEILENHQPMQVLRGVGYSDKAAVNLKLKNGSKATWVANVYAGGGLSNAPSGALWDAEFLAMGIFAKHQTLLIAKTNNKGKSLGEQVDDLLSGKRNTDLEEYIKLTLSLSPSLDKRRTLFNRSHLLSASHMWKSGNIDVKAQVDYNNQRTTTEDITTTTYYTEYGNEVIIEDTDGKKHEHRLTGSVTVEANKANYYLSNTLKTELEWNDISTLTMGTLPNTQTARLPNRYVQNDFKMIRRFGDKHLVSFYSTNEWQTKPQWMRATIGQSLSHVFQETNDNAFYSGEHASYAFVLNGLNISLDGGVETYFRTMISNASGYDESLGYFSNDIKTNYARLHVTPKVEYKRGQFDFSLQCPASISRYSLSSSLGGDTNLSALSPTINVRWHTKSFFTFVLGGSIGRTPMPLHDIYTGNLYSDYRTLRQGANALYIGTNSNFIGRIAYRNSPNGLFANLVGIKMWTSSPYQTARSIKGDNIVYSYEPNKVLSQDITVIGNVSKLLSFIHGAISLSGSFSRTLSSLLSDGIDVAYTNTSLAVNPRINGSISDFVDFSYEMKYQRSILKMDFSETSTLDDFEHVFNLSLRPWQPIVFEVGGEYYDNQLTSSRRKDMLMFDARLTWKVQHNIDLQLSATNILDKRQYSYTLNSTLSTVESTRYLRGREILFTIFLK